MHCTLLSFYQLIKGKHWKQHTPILLQVGWIVLKFYIANWQAPLAHSDEVFRLRLHFDSAKG